MNVISSVSYKELQTPETHFSLLPMTQLSSTIHEKYADVMCNETINPNVPSDFDEYVEPNEIRHVEAIEPDFTTNERKPLV